MKTNYRTAFVDIETAPSLGWVWEKWETNVLSFEMDWYMLSFSVKWRGEKRTKTRILPDYPGYKPGVDDDRALTQDLWEVINEADLIVWHNGDKFDHRKSNTRFLLNGFPPPAPFKSIDTLKIARKHFSFTSNKLDDLGQFLGVGRKVKHTGFSLWLGCIQGDEKCWNTMRKYNGQDVLLLERVYDKLKPWHATHPNINANDDPEELRCPACGSSDVIQRGWAIRKTYRTKRFSCQECGKWSGGGRDKIPGVFLS